MAVIKFEHVSKAYKLGAAHLSLRESASKLVKRLLGRNGTSSDQTFQALEDVSFKVEGGQALALIGPNGAGKTTTLKLLSKVARPTRGHIQVNGKLRDKVIVPASISEVEAKELALSRERVKAYIDGKKLTRVIYVPKRVVNIVVAS